MGYAVCREIGSVLRAYKPAPRPSILAQKGALSIDYDGIDHPHPELFAATVVVCTPERATGLLPLPTVMGSS